MRSIIVASILALFLAIGVTKAEAHPVVLCPPVMAAAGGATGIGILFPAFTLGGAALVPLIISGFDPWTKVFPKVEYSYPKPKNY